MTRISIIAAIGKNRELGKGNDLIWRIPDDLQRFKALTMGHPIIMGRKTFDSIGRPLPGRMNIVVTRTATWSFPGVEVAHSLEDALTQATNHDSHEVFVCGGAELYAQALPHTHRLYLTLIDDTSEADTFFPAWESDFTTVLTDEPHEWNGTTYRWYTVERATVPFS